MLSYFAKSKKRTQSRPIGVGMYEGRTRKEEPFRASLPFDEVDEISNAFDDLTRKERRPEEFPRSGPPLPLFLPTC
ncbi:hypothetical protein CRG98_002915 [Punica granatum]|uniref:Uncharacterized protein n=1 Tax=Punica granatum TaxID=22663 RepID=A0A2I0L904_PUNGR|nr:hypothetical protein CRG98_002915 [Punica granatum]